MTKLNKDSLNYLNQAIMIANEYFKNYEIQDIIKSSKKFITSQKSQGKSLSEILQEFSDMNFTLVSKYSAYTHREAVLLKAYDDLKSNIQKALQVFLNSDDKEDYYTYKGRKYDYDTEENLITSSKDVISIIANNNPDLDIESVIQSEPKSFEDYFARVLKEVKKTTEEKLKGQLISSIRYYLEYIDYLDNVSDMFLKQNEVYRKTKNDKSKDYNNSGLSCLIIPENQVKDLYSKDKLNACTLMQLDAIISFLVNRVGKIKGQIGTGLFFFQMTNFNETVLNDEESLRTLWQKKAVFDLISKEIYNTFSTDEFVVTSENGALYYQIDDDDIRTILEKYESEYANLFPNSGSIYDDYDVYRETISSTDVGRYFGKDSFLESLIIYADESKINWGYTKEDKKSGRYVLISFDIPGLNMPLRLHMEKSRLQKVVASFLKSDEIPVYCGEDDFSFYGNNIGTQIIYPIDKKMKKSLQSVVKRKDFSVGYLSFGEHISHMQEPNSSRRICKWKSGGKRDYPDYYNVCNGTIREVRVEHSQSS